jgi:hypothetical protein
VLSFLERPSQLWETDVEAARELLSASISLLLRHIGRDPEPTRSRDHVVRSVFAELRLRAFCDRLGTIMHGRCSATSRRIDSQGEVDSKRSMRCKNSESRGAPGR